MTKILLNSYPRTGMSVLNNLLRVAYNRNEIEEYGEYSNRDSFFIWSHTPVTLLAKFNDINQITIIRQPLDAISSLAAKLDSGIGLDVHDNQISYYNPHKENFESIALYIDHTVETMTDEYLSYLENCTNNIDNLIPFTFEQVVNEPKFVLDLITKTVGGNFLSLSDQEIKGINDFVYAKWEEEDSLLPTSAKRNPVSEKSEFYYQFKIYLSLSKKLKDLNDAYEFAIYKIKQRQKILLSE